MTFSTRDTRWVMLLLDGASIRHKLYRRLF